MKNYEDYKLTKNLESIRCDEENATVAFIKKVPRDNGLYDVFVDYTFLTPEEIISDEYCKSQIMDSDLYMEDKNGILVDCITISDEKLQCNIDIEHKSDFDDVYYKILDGFVKVPYIYTSYHKNKLVSSVKIKTNNHEMLLSFSYDNKGRLINKNISTVSPDQYIKYNNINEYIIYDDNDFTSKSKVYKNSQLITTSKTKWDSNFKHKDFEVTRDIFSGEIIQIEKFNYSDDGTINIIRKNLYCGNHDYYITNGGVK